MTFPIEVGVGDDALPVAYDASEVYDEQGLFPRERERKHTVIKGSSPGYASSKTS